MHEAARGFSFLCTSHPLWFHGKVVRASLELDGQALAGLLQEVQTLFFEKLGLDMQWLERLHAVERKTRFNSLAGKGKRGKSPSALLFW